jgi:deazaflavin-dependent oxidoreductase (nitroreductase family)
MAHKQNNETDIYLTPGLSQPAQRALKAAGYTRLEQIAGVTEADLLKLHGVGPKAIETLRHALAEKGLVFAGATPPPGASSHPSEQGVLHPPEKGVEKVYDSPRDWVGSHIRDYVESDGKKGYLWRGMPTLLLTTRGRKSGKLRRTALIYGRDGENYLLVASSGGSPRHPNWYLNLAANPMVEIQVQDQKLKARAHTADPQEKKRLWPVMSKIFPTYDEYIVKAGKAGREIPLIVLEPM